MYFNVHLIRGTFSSIVFDHHCGVRAGVMRLITFFGPLKTLCALVCLWIGSVAAFGAASTKNSAILFIGDGMGFPHVTLTRAYNAAANQTPRLVMDTLLVGAAGTRANSNETEHVSGLVTDSAAAATALGTGYRTYNGAIGLMVNGEVRPVASFLTAAHESGKATGVVTTTRVTHATPAAFIAHVRDRQDETTIAAQYLASGVNVIFGGGECQFVADRRQAFFGQACREDHQNLKQAFAQRAYQIVHNTHELEKATGNKVLGLFATSHMPFVTDRTEGVPSLLVQTQQAVRLLEQDPQGFVLVVEAGRIDHAAHAHDPASLVHELLELDAVMAWAKTYVDAHPNVAFVATADHETGGLTLGRNGVYDYYPEILKKVAHSFEFNSDALTHAKTDDAFIAIMRQQAGIQNLKASELNMLRHGLDGQGRPSALGRERAYNAVISGRAGLGWTTYAHTGVDVPLYAYGKIKTRFMGQISNIEIAEQIADFLEVDMVAASKKLQEIYFYPHFRSQADGKIRVSRKDMIALLSPALSVYKEDYLSIEQIQAVVKRKMHWETSAHRLVIDA